MPVERDQVGRQLKREGKQKNHEEEVDDDIFEEINVTLPEPPTRFCLLHQKYPFQTRRRCHEAWRSSRSQTSSVAFDLSALKTMSIERQKERRNRDEIE